MFQPIDVIKKVKKTRIKLHSIDTNLKHPVETCFGQTLKNQAVTVEVNNFWKPFLSHILIICILRLD